MVLTNFEFWAADGSSSMPSTATSLEFETSAHHHNRHMNPFDPRVVPHVPHVPTRHMTHLSSNGYYGFSYINAAHDSELNNNNNNNNNITNNNNISTHNFMDVNGMNITPTPAVQQQQPPPYANFIGNNSIEKPPAVNVAAAAIGNASRCKKRFFVVNSDDADSNGAATYCTNASAKRCRFDDDFAAQYCNDFFSLPSTQIATQSCLMDTEEGVLQQPHQQQQQQLHQQQLDEAMYENNNNNVYNYNNNNIEKHEQSILHLQLQQQQTQMPAQHEQPPTQQQQDLQQQQQQQQPQYHQQQHYQDDTIITTQLCHHRHHHHQPNNGVDISLLPPLSKTPSYYTEHDYTVLYLPNSAENQNVTTNDVDDDFHIDDATLFAQLHGGCLHHFLKSQETRENPKEFKTNHQMMLDNNFHKSKNFEKNTTEI